MNEEMEKLAQEIRRRFLQLPTLLVLGQVATQEGKELLSDAFIHSLITRIGKAYADGLPLPDEAGRLQIEIRRLSGPRWIDLDNANDILAWFAEKWKQGAVEFIALREQEPE